jgi:hypothetical protein
MKNSTQTVICGCWYFVDNFSPFHRLQKIGVLVQEGNTSAARWVLLADIK